MFEFSNLEISHGVIPNGGACSLPSKTCHSNPYGYVFSPCSLIVTRVMYRKYHWVKHLVQTRVRNFFRKSVAVFAAEPPYHRRQQ